ncbi:ribonuclease III [Eremomyces bilateralis CBS 781.70]|uniref:Ribonuclease III n=1 Tax=Eremomyces bilateralis CBS 781.70 TaxID=1392243 RepID=A0A6G1G5P1_9PEZI|nr:ribonuclease III [Eremomyces bilateralis CBS 781.70]KAF1813261.1 ribonuclease III [Eremomyces bilateralis CBS 781.70]
MDRKRKLDDPVSSHPQASKKPKGNGDLDGAFPAAELQKLLDTVLERKDVSESIFQSAKDLKEKISSSSALASPKEGQKQEQPDVHPQGISKPSTPNLPKASATNKTRLPPLPIIKSEVLLGPIFTHSSFDAIRPLGTDTHTYEPLEFLGDVYIELAATRLVHLRPRIKVNRKSSIRELCVKNETLATFSRKYGLDQRLRIAGSLEDWGTKGTEKILGDVFEAYVAGVVEEHGYAVAEAWLWGCWEPLLAEKLKEEWTQAGQDEPQKDGTQDLFEKDPKTGLARLLLSPGVKLDYITENEQKFAKKGFVKYTVSLYLTGWGYVKQKLGVGVDHSVKLAGIAAAKDAMKNQRDFILVVNAEKIRTDAERKAQRERELQTSSSQL